MKEPVFRQIKESLRNQLLEAWRKAAQNGELPSPTETEEIQIEVPKERAHGAFASNLALGMAKAARRSPREVADILLKYLPPNAYLLGAEKAGAGFINFFLKPLWLSEVLFSIAEDPKGYGRNEDLAGEKIQIEFISANPVGPMNVVNARAGALGDSLARLFECCGAEVSREYYINDHGLQVHTLGRSIEARYIELLGGEVDFPTEGYQGEYVCELAEELITAKGRSLLALDEAERVEFCQDWGYQRILASQQRDLADYGIIYDHWFSERKLHQSGAVEDVARRMEEKGLLYLEDGAVWFRSTDFGDDKDRVLRTADGRTTYFTADIAYHLNKIERGFSHLINIWGPDHHGYISRMKAAMIALGFDPERLEILIAQQINLLKDGKPFKMSKRRGEFVTMRDLLDEVGNDAARWYFLMRSPDSHLDFDLDLATEQTPENPVFYVQYAHARICSLFREFGQEFIPKRKPMTETIWEDDEQEILEKAAIFPETVSTAARLREPHRLTTYLLELATLFHSYYNRRRFLTEDQEVTCVRLSLAFTVRTIIQNGLALLGISAPEKM